VQKLYKNILILNIKEFPARSLSFTKMRNPDIHFIHMKEWGFFMIDIASLLLIPHTLKLGINNTLYMCLDFYLS
jgi:hypothetical protein